jgi:predicted Fe-Mo cluster-binding NifX family protein
MADPRWGRADWGRDVVDGEIMSWQAVKVSWSRLQDEGTRVRTTPEWSRFLREHRVEAVVANDIGDGVVWLLDAMGVPVHLGAAGDARAAVRQAVSREPW